MSIQVACHECDKSFKVKDRYSGLTGACPYCGTMLVVPEVIEADELVVQDEPTSGSQTTSSLSLLTKVPMAPCPACSKDILVGSSTCFYCGAIVSTESHGSDSETGEEVLRSHIQQAMAGEQAKQESSSGK